jgi:uncharacterized membrane protein
MKKWILWTALGIMVVAIVAHIITLIMIPINMMDKTMAKYPTNQLLKGKQTVAQSRDVVRPSPDLVYSIVCYDVSKEPIRFKAKAPTDTYWSVSMFEENSDNFFVVNDRQIKSNPVEILLVRQGTQYPDAGNAQVVVSPTNRGILLVRYLLESDDKYQELFNIQKQSSLIVGSSVEAATPVSGGLSFEAVEYVNPAYSFTIKYPKAWKENPVSGKQVFVAAAAAKVPTMIVSIREESAFADAVKAALTESGNTEINIGPEKAIKLADGTPASQSGLKFKIKSGYDADALAQGVQKNGKWILVTITTVSLAAPFDEAQFSEILQSLQFNK